MKIKSITTKHDKTQLRSKIASKIGISKQYFNFYGNQRERMR